VRTVKISGLPKPTLYLIKFKKDEQKSIRYNKRKIAIKIAESLLAEGFVFDCGPLREPNEDASTVILGVYAHKKEIDIP
jgi:hypothetical protein